MFTLLLLVSALLITSGDLAERTIDCGISRNLEAYFVEIEGTFMEMPWFAWFLTSFLMYVLLDVTTLLLYWCKIRSLSKYRNNKENEIYSRIQHILYRVLILTLFYQIGGLLVYVINTTLTFYDPDTTEEFNVIGAAVISCLVRYSMFLMQEHNTDEYVQFLRCLNRYKLYLCCCCCCGMVRRQYRMTIVDEAELSETARNKNKVSHSIETSQTQVIGKTGMELSVATVTVIADGSSQRF